MTLKPPVRWHWLALLCAAALTACGGGSDGTPASTSAGRMQAQAADDDTSWTPCAAEWGQCNFSGTREVRYGLDGQWAYRTATDSIACNNDVFGDPLPGADKVCQVAQPPAPVATWTHCANEHGTCSFSGTRQVRYGLDGQYAYRTATASIACSNEVFGDPLPGADKVCEVAAEGTASPQPPQPPQPPAADGPYGQNAADYVLTFRDEFDGNRLDESKWATQLWYLSPDDTPNFEVSNGSLKIFPAAGTRYHRDYRHITTDGKFHQTYGYFEVEARLPRGKGVWPAFWLLNHDQPHPHRPEIDVMEAYPGGGPESGWGDADLRPVMFESTVHFGEGRKVGSRKLDTPDLSAGYHRYGVKWEPGKQTFYFDGQPFYTLNVDMNERMFMLLSLQFGSASGEGDASTPTGTGNAYDIRYVRAWQLKSRSSASRIVEYHGDSTVWGYRSGTGGQVETPAPAAFAAALAAAGQPHEVRNEGVSGSTACELLNGNGRHAPFSQHIASSIAQFVIFNHAINDQWKNDIPSYQSCLRELARLARSHGKQVLFETPNPTRDSGPGGLDAYVEAMRAVAAQEHVPVIDQYAVLTDRLGGQSVTTICPDGLHPTQQLYLDKGRYAAQRFQQLLEAGTLSR